MIPDIHNNVVWTDLKTAATLMGSVAAGRKPMQLICSPTGFGKTTIAKQQFRHYGIVSEEEFYRNLPPLPEISATGFPSLSSALLKPQPQTRRTAMRRAVQGLPPLENANAKKRLFIETRPTKAISLVRTLHLCSVLQASALLFDDPGRIAGDEAACDVLKTAFGMQRTVTFETPEITRNENWRISGKGSYDPFIPPPDFPVPEDLRWLWLANVNYTDPAVLARLGDHFAPLIARGLNPFWIRDDAEHDYHDLFLCVHHMATEENLLRSMGFPYEVSRKAVNFYVTHANKLLDLCPRRLELIARAYAADQSQVALDAELNSMAPSIIRPKLKLPAPWVAVPDGLLLWPEQPFSKQKPVTENDPPRRIRKRERDYKRAHQSREASASHDGPPTEQTAPSFASDGNVEPAPEPTVPPVPVDAEQPEIIHRAETAPGSITQAIGAIYQMGDVLACDLVADVLGKFPLGEWDADDLNRLAEALDGCSVWMQQEAIAEVYFQHDPAIKLFCDKNGVLVYEPGEAGLQIHSWLAIEQQLAPVLATQRERHHARQCEKRGREILKTKLPKVRKLKAMKALVDESLTCLPKISDEGKRAAEHIRAMSRDDPQFEQCTTFMAYFEMVVNIIRQPKSADIVIDLAAERQ